MYRQKDTVLIDILNEVRTGVIGLKTKGLLEACTRRVINEEDGIKPTRLYATNVQVDEINDAELRKLEAKGGIRTYEATDKGHTKFEKQLENLPAQKTLRLAVGAQVPPSPSPSLPLLCVAQCPCPVLSLQRPPYPAPR